MATKIAGDMASEAATGQPAPQGSESTRFRLLSAPVLVNVGEDRVTILIAVSHHATGWVELGTSRAKLQRVRMDQDGMLPFDDRLLRFEVTGLQAGTRYHYRVCVQTVTFHNAYKVERGEVIETETYSFRTLNAAALTASFTCWNDTHENRESLVRLSERLQQNPTDFLLWNGDITNDINREEQLVGQFLNPSGLPFAAATPLFLGRGNHDIRGRDARLLSKVINGPEERNYYAFRQGPVAFVVMDSGEDKPDELPVYAGLNDYAAYRSRQAEWLSGIIRQRWFRTAPFRVAFIHIPLVWEAEVPEHWPAVWGQGIKGWICEDGQAKWHDLLEKAKVNVVISGHTHTPAWFPARRGRSYAQLIGGGPRPEQLRTIIGKASQTEMTIALEDFAGKTVETYRFRRSGFRMRI